MQPSCDAARAGLLIACCCGSRTPQVCLCDGLDDCCYFRLARQVQNVRRGVMLLECFMCASSLKHTRPDSNATSGTSMHKRASDSLHNVRCSAGPWTADACSCAHVHTPMCCASTGFGFGHGTSRYSDSRDGHQSAADSLAANSQ